MDFSTPGAGAVAATDAGEPLWDWGNLLDFAVHDDDDSLLLPWASTTTSSDSIQPPVSGPAPPAPQPPPPAEPAVGRGPRVRKRDPRLVCPNYLAGRVPCACPEVDEMAAAAEVEEVAAEMLAGARKRARAGRGGGGGGGGGAAAEVRCQVPGCEADIRELKGYHRRHRVCLRCAHAAAVVLDGVQKRYCQQCGKFHILPDFDEGKRSCRRKLEWHNKRRRRRPDSKGTVEKELEDQLDLSADASGDGELREENTKATASEMVETVLSNKVLDRETPMGSEDGHSSPTCMLPSLQNDQSNSILSFAASAEASVHAKLENAKLTHSPIYCDSKSAYSSSCPTGRISFKLYDWNPAEFPRRLRHQIFEWLASMPVELEGYIRPGCTILTVFIAMPQHMWDKVSEDATHLVRGLVTAPDSLLLGRGTSLIYLNEMVFQILKDGTTLMSTRLEVQAPRIHYVHPTCFEAGKPIEFIVCGSYLDQPKFRSLLSFDGEYLKHDYCRLTSNGTTTCVGNGDYIHNSQHEIFRINISQSNVNVYGPAFVEVENVSGLSNFVPILFGSKQLCSELERIEDVLCNLSYKNNSISGEFSGASSDSCEHVILKQTAMSGLLTDIGWLVRKPSPDELKNVLSLTNIQRWTCVLRFLVQYDFVNVLEIILHSLDNVIGSEIHSNLEKGRLEAVVVIFLEYVSHARKIIHHRAKHDVKPQLETSWIGDTIPHNLSLSSSVPSAKENKGANGESDLCSTSAAYEGEQSVPLVTKDVTHRQCCHPQLHAKWRNHSLVATFPSGAMRTRIVMTLAVAAVLCFAACVVLFHPRKGGVLAAPVKTYLFGGSTS